MRQIVLDTETTGLDPSQGHRIIEIGCVELVDRRLTGKHYHQYLQPDRGIDEAAIEIHGITNEFLHDMPHFCDIVADYLDFIKGAELIIHNAPFDVGFINNELKLLGGEQRDLENYCTVLDTLVLARKLHPGQKNSLDALCKRYNIDNSQRTLHGALLDAEILADVYLAMTGGQTSLLLDESLRIADQPSRILRQVDPRRKPLRIIHANGEELSEHNKYVEMLQQQSGGESIWKIIDGQN